MTGSRGWPLPLRPARLAPLLLVLGFTVWTSPGLEAQEGRRLMVEGPDGSVVRIAVTTPDGYAVVEASELERLGWTFFQDRDVARARSAAARELVLRAGSSWVRWGDELYQLADAPSFAAGKLQVPLQVAVDLFPQILPNAYEYSESAGRLRVLRREFWRPEVTEAVAEAVAAPLALPRVPPPSGNLARETGRSNASTSPETSPVRVVIIDPGHGGRDPGAVGRKGVREKDVALAVGRALARELRRDSTLEVYMTREDDTLVDLWKRGELATRWKGERPGVFISLHANALPRSRSIRGYETYFLSEARTEHERRVAAIENAPLEIGPDEARAYEDSDLNFILKELRTLDHQHWSALLAELVQEELHPVHPGPDRGVKQGPFAVITNALMPSVLVEIGFLTNPQEELLLGQRSFQDGAARAMAEAVRQFFERYPPGQGPTSEAGR